MGRGMIPEDILSMKWVSDPQLAPDGRWVAYIVKRVDPKNLDPATADKYVTDIWLTATDGANGPRQLTNGGSDTAPRWSPDGRTIAFLSKRSGENQLWLIAVDGGEARRLTHTKGAIGTPVWSPDGQSIAFAAKVGPDGLGRAEAGAGAGADAGADGGASAARRGGKGDSAARQAPANGLVQSQAAIDAGLSPKSDVRFINRLRYKFNGEGLLGEKRSQIFVVDVTGEAASSVGNGADSSPEPRQLTSGDFDHGAPAWSPDGHYLAFAADRDPEADHRHQSDVWVIPAAGGEPVRVTDGGGHFVSPAWSPDGRHLACLGHHNEVKSVTLHHIWLWPAAGAEAGPGGSGSGHGSAAAGRCLNPNFDLEPGNHTGSDVVSSPDPGLVWAEDGRLIYFLASDGGRTKAWACPVPAAGETGASAAPASTPASAASAPAATASPSPAPVATASPFAVIAGDRMVYGFAYAHGRFAYVASGPEVIGDLYACIADGSSEIRLTSVNADLLAGLELARPESFTYPDEDGRPIEGWIMKPLGWTKGRKYPLVLEIHGGPHAAYGWGFFQEFQCLAAAGFGVLYTNPHGSQGYGQDFVAATHHDWGGRDYRDLMGAVDWALKLGWVDPERLGVTGGSYGGYMTNWTITQTSRFRAAVTCRSTSNRYSQFGSSDAAYMNGEWEFPGNPWESEESARAYLERSPITHVTRVRTPLLIIHNEQDLRCPIEQAEQLYTALKLLRREVAFARFPDENHEMSRSGKPKHRVERLRLMVRWMEKHLQSAKD